jgi:hypothetical protein
MPASIPWWGWILLAVVLWYVQLMMGIYTDSGSIRAWVIRIALIAGMVISALIGVIRFVKWIWQS